MLRQQPDPGSRIVRGGVIVLTLSKGPERYKVPDVVGKAKELAKADLEAAPFRFQVVDGTARYDDNVPAGTVVATNPVVGTEVAPGSKVELIVSKGRAPITVPTVVGMQFEEAKTQLEGLGLKVTPELVNDSPKPRGEILEQTPGGGSGAEKGQEVKLKVSNNPHIMAMPNVMDRPCRESADRLRSMGLHVEVHGGPLAEFFGKVVRQDPAAGTGIQPGQVVRIECRQ